MSRSPLIFSVLTLVFVSGCASTNFAKTAAPATITEQRIKLASGTNQWGVNKLVQVGEVKLGYYGPRGGRANTDSSGTTYTFDAGPTVIAAWYYDTQTGNHLVNQTPLTKMQVELKPRGRYELRSVKKEGRLQFLVIDLEANASVATSDWISLSQKLLPEPAGESGGTAFSGMLRMIK
ncbi:hypothetical protein [Noviherbaspirillum malthae]|uniref:hypothetical protein n=1 Tax=Noviherbaspirillum malthae TaxID=1260987 RepID=UPI00188E7B8B|nr:hypothetical protein [Noviherbaspirillum malthae]